MLVLSRKKNQKITFAKLGISVEILRLNGNTVRIGVDAPKEVRVVRDELANDEDRADESSVVRHAVRNRLHKATLALHVAQKMLERGRADDAERTMAQALQEFAELDQLIDPDGPSDAAHATRRALLVEDDANERELLAGYLRMCGYEVDTVPDGMEAMRYLSSGSRPDVILLDMHMPRLDGPKTISAIRANPEFAGLKVFAVSGADPDVMSIPIGNRGVNRWFSKPLNPNRFVEALEQELEVDSACA